MKIREKCSCGASFAIEAEEAMKLVREWRKKHICPDPVEELRETSLSSQNERADTIGLADYPLGFRYAPEEDDE